VTVPADDLAADAIGVEPAQGAQETGQERFFEEGRRKAASATVAGASAAAAAGAGSGVCTAESDFAHG